TVLQSQGIGDVVYNGAYTYTLALRGQKVLITAFEGNNMDPAHEVLAALFDSTTKGYLVWRPSNIDPTNGPLIGHVDFDLDTGDLVDYVFLDAAVVHPNGPGVRQESRIHFSAPPHPGADQVIFKIATSVRSQDLTTKLYTTLNVASSFPQQGGGAYLYTSGILPAIALYMDGAADDVDGSLAPAALKALTPTASDFFQPFTPVAPASPPENDPVFKFPP
ncbi:MAG: hypothetical protein JWM80_342, partial [Cyanobacteria bacterium RYN_339]|nr:hypothetical protein [Cyanobacteria bacterium RYN_339]